jgi:hypothetical protein
MTYSLAFSQVNYVTTEPEEGGKLKHIKIDNFYSIREIKNVLYSVSGN